MSAVSGLRSGADEQADGRGSGNVRDLMLPIGVLAGAAVVGIAVALVASPPAVPQFSRLAGSPTPLAPTQRTAPLLPATPAPSSTASGDVAESGGFVESFDLLSMGTEVVGWDVSDGASLEVAPRPTAVDRSARLSALATGTACRSVPHEITTLVAEFMVDRSPAEPGAVVELKFRDGNTLGIVVGGEEMAVADASPTAFEPGSWYRWHLVRRGNGFAVRLTGPDGTPPAEGQVDISAGAEEICLLTQAPERVYLSRLEVEG